MAESNDLCGKVEDALVAYFKSLTDLERGGITSNCVFASFEDLGNTKAFPLIACECNDLDFPPQQKGNWRGVARVWVMSLADPSAPGARGARDAHRARVGVVFDLVLNTGFGAFVQAAIEDFTVFELDIRGQGQALNSEKRRWENFIAFELEVCGSTIN
jgi:hypothetical protein